MWLQMFNAIVSFVASVGETGLPGENHPPVARYSQSVSHKVVLSTPSYKNSQFLAINSLRI